MFRGLAAIFYKEVRHVVRDPATFVLALFIPIVQLTVFGYAIDTDVRHIKTIVLDGSKTAQSRAYVESLVNTEYFEITESATSIDDVLAALRSGRARVGVVIDRRFAESPISGEPPRVQVLVDGSDPTVSTRAQNTAMLLATASTTPSIDVRPRTLFNEEGRSAMFYVPGLAAVIFQVVLTMLTAFAVVKEREAGTLEQLLVTPVTRAGLMAGKLLPFLAIGCVAAAIVYAAMVVVFQVPIRGDLGTLTGLTLLYLFTCLALGLVISTFARTQLHAMLIAFAVMLPSILLSGFAFPRESMPEPIYAFTFVLPTTYFVNILRGVVLRGATFTDLTNDVLALSAIGVTLFVLGTVRFRKRLD
ncbi:MAG: ABC transporter permease [Planctomycetes bacterium]|nr:ABC transporter permease [Planctomycetota bacterium]MCC7170680.1 ABC transporter permease [Planctomycetota bacterium]